jgi:hypothetical protein
VSVLVREHVWVPADHLAHDRLDHVAKRERPLLFRHARMKHHLQQEIAEFVAEIVEIAARDGVDDLVGLLDRVGRDGRKGLFEVPGAAAAGCPKPRHEFEQSVDVAGRGHVAACPKDDALCRNRCRNPSKTNSEPCYFHRLAEGSLGAKALT